MKRIAVALLCLIPLTIAAHADEASKRTKLEELFALLRVDQVSTQVMSNFDRQMQGLSTHQFGPSPTPDQQKQFDELHIRISGLVQQTIGWKVIEPDFLKIYGEAYTEPEIDSFLTFYKSPAGKTLVSKSPELASKSLQITQQHMSVIEPQLRQMVQEFVKQTTPASSAAPSLNSPAAPSPSTTPKPKQ